MTPWIRKRKDSLFPPPGRPTKHLFPPTLLLADRLADPMTAPASAEVQAPAALMFRGDRHAASLWYCERMNCGTKDSLAE